MLGFRDKGILIQIIAYCERIKEKSNGIDLEIFKNDIDTRDIICFNVFQIGELAKSLTDDFIKEYNEVPWKDIKGMRDRIAHGYGTIDFSIIWVTANEDIEILGKYCRKILDDNQ